MNIIADREKIERILERIAYQIAENYCHEKKIFFVGIKDSGYQLAEEMIKYLNPILNIETELIALEIDKKNPATSPIVLSKNIDSKNCSIILVDDVINSGKTIFYALKPFFELKINSLQTLILVERKHKRFPIVADYVGISLNTTLLERIEVKVVKNKLYSVELI
jgi:pyrimidine operon attenuation protein / uracil phosphoribosyltransferase